MYFGTEDFFNHFEYSGTLSPTIPVTLSPKDSGNRLFWETDINRIDWLQKRAVIERVIERGNDEEKAEIRRFYGDVKASPKIVAVKNKV